MKAEKRQWVVFAKSAWASGTVDESGNLKRLRETATVFESKEDAEKAKRAFLEKLDIDDWCLWKIEAREI